MSKLQANNQIKQQIYNENQTGLHTNKYMSYKYVCETEGPGRRGRLVLRWKDRMKEYMHERVADSCGRIELLKHQTL